jgi:hypothetical protein
LFDDDPAEGREPARVGSNRAGDRSERGAKPYGELERSHPRRTGRDTGA